MSELGNKLKQAREEQDKTLAAVKNDTRIQESFLIAIEEGNYKALPSYLHAYGFVKKYAEYLGFDYADIKGIFDKECPKSDSLSAEGKPTDHPAQELIVNNPITNKLNKSTKTENSVSVSSYKKLPDNRDFGNGKSFPFIPVVVAVAVVGVLVLIIFNSVKGPNETPVAVIDNFSESSPIASESSPINNFGIDNQSLTNPTDNTTSVYSPTPETPQVADNQTVKDNATVRTANTPQTDNVTKPIQTAKQETFTLAFSEDCWVKYSADNKTSQEYLAPAGTNLSLKFEKSFTLDIGNAAAVTMKYGAQTFGGFGRPGIVRKLFFKLEDGILTRVNE